jgi:hypothetical protein
MPMFKKKIAKLSPVIARTFNQVSPELSRVRLHDAELTALEAEAALVEPDTDVTTGQPQKPRSRLIIEDDTDHPSFENLKITYVGRGAGSILAAAYLSERGVSNDRITTIDPRPGFGGIWLERWARSGGFNNPQDLVFLRHYLTTAHRDGANMLEFLQRIAENELRGATNLQDAASSIHYDNLSERWVVGLAGDSPTRYIESDVVVVSNGFGKISPINSLERIKGNLDNYADGQSSGIKIERRQRKLTKKELSSGKPIVIIGVGNSANTILRQIKAHHENTGLKPPFYVLTDKSMRALSNPELAIDGEAIWRNPGAGYLTGYSGDLKEDRDAYWYAFENNAFVASTRDTYYDPKTEDLYVSFDTRARRHEIRLNRPHVFALYGMQPDHSLVDQGRNAHLVDRYSGRVSREFDGKANPGLYVVGAAGAVRGNDTSAVIPGIMGRLPHLAMSIAVESIVAI